MMIPTSAEITIPGAILGYRRNGQPIRLIAGGSGEDDGPAPASGPETGEDPTADPTTQPADDLDPSGEPTTGKPGQDPDDDLEKWKANSKKNEQRAKANKKELDKARAELDKIKKDQQATLDAIAQALGLKQGETVDPAKQIEQLTAQAAEKDAQLRETRIELAIYTTAGKHGAKPTALQDSRAFMRKVSELDPDADDFTERLIEAAKEAVKSNPSLAADTPKPSPPPKSGGEMPGAPKGGQRKRPTSLSEAVARRLSGTG